MEMFVTRHLLSDCHLSRARHVTWSHKTMAGKMSHRTELQHVSVACGVSAHSSNAIRATAGCELYALQLCEVRFEVFTAMSRSHYVLRNVDTFLPGSMVMARMTM
jgi:hypothetical protein